LNKKNKYIRKPITKKDRFEVFKRDKFTCQYCGKSAPEVVLEIDHIIPVASGGDNNIMNYITACKECNIGKKHRELSDNSVLVKQKKQLDDLQERKDQLKMMAKWREELLNLDTETSDLICREIHKIYKNQYSINELGKKNIISWLKKFSIKTLLESIDLSTKYLEVDKDNKFTKNSVELFFNKIPKIAYIRDLSEKDPDLGQAFFLNSIINKKYKNAYYYKGDNLVLRMKNLIKAGYYEDLRAVLNSQRRIESFIGFINDLEKQFSETSNA
jgi:hypothetical protein